MASYGLTTYGDQAKYDGTAGYRPSALEGIGSLLHFMGLNRPSPYDPTVFFPITGQDSVDKRIFAGIQATLGIIETAGGFLGAPETGGISLVAAVDGGFRAAQNLHYLMYEGDGNTSPSGAAMNNALVSSVPAIKDAVTTGLGSSVLDPTALGGIVRDNSIEYTEAYQAADKSFVPATSATMLATILRHLSLQAATVGYPDTHSGDYFLCHQDIELLGWDLQYLGVHEYLHPPVPVDWSDLRADDTPVALALRQNPSMVWTNVNPLGFVTPFAYTADVTSAGYTFYWRLRYTREDLQRIYAAQQPQLEPVWPGAGKVSLGTPIPITGIGRLKQRNPEAAADAGHLLGAMNGVVLDVDTVPVRQGKYILPDFSRYPYLGWLAFIADNGAADELQRIEFSTAVYCPRSFGVAAGVDYFLAPGATATITPWTRL